jgi:hypothetical protein
MSNFKLNLPTDIPWERICVTEDMIDPVVCDRRLPAKWQTSLAVFKYRPDAEFQLYPQYDITYLKVTATITGYQPLDKEIQGTINWNGVDVATIPGLTDLLNSYNPCHGAILQVVVGPHGTRQKIPLDRYPFFMDFEPKKRELYEQATDTKEKQSRSIESLNITKSGGTTQSLEILDIDQGGGGFGASGSYAGTGGGFNYSAPNGQWGTKRLNAEESLSSRSSDVGQEKRETFSFTTQLSQMYHLLDSYHIGTNRVVFFIQPRPHTLEEPSGFVRGPRPVDGIQEFFMVVAQPKDQEDFCVSLRLDTSHLTKTPILDYERKSETTSIASANAKVASNDDIPAENIVGQRACVPIFDECWDVHYQCYRTEANDSVTYSAPSGYRIESYNDLINDSTHGSTNIVITPNQAALNINVEANGHICYEGSEVCVDCPDTIQEWAGHARRQVQVNLISTTPTKQVGEREVLMITTRGLCCCASDKLRKPMDEFVVGIKQIPSYLSPSKLYSASYSSNKSASTQQIPMFDMAASQSSEVGICKECGDNSKQIVNPAVDMKANIRQVNELSDFIKSETIKSLNDPNVKLQKFADTEFFVKQLEYQVMQTKKGREILAQGLIDELPDSVTCSLEAYFKKPAENINRQDLLSIRNLDLARMADISAEDAQKIKMISLGVEFHPHQEGDDCDPTED